MIEMPKGLSVHMIKYRWVLLSMNVSKNLETVTMNSPRTNENLTPIRSIM